MNSSLSHRKNGALDWLCLRAIAFYQRHLSPRKGWRCAYARLHGGTGCSGFARQAIENHGWHDASPLIRARFRACAQAGRTLRAQSDISLDKGETPKKRASKTDWCNSSDCTFLDLCDGRWCRCADALVDCGPGDSGCCDVGDCNCSPCD